MTPPPPLPPLYARALRLRVYALSLWLGRLALAPLGLARYTEPLLALPVALGLAGAVLGPLALWRIDRRAAAVEIAAGLVALIPAVGWMRLSYGATPTADAALPWGVAPFWLAAAPVAWLLALAVVGQRTATLRPTAWLPALALLALDLPPTHQHIFAVSPRLAEALAPLSMVLAIFALARMEKATMEKAAGAASRST